MDNYNEVLKALDDFNDTIPSIEDGLPSILEDYFKQVSKSGATHFVWSKIKNAFSHKLECVMATYEEDFPVNSYPVLPNVDNLSFEEMAERLRGYISELSGIPFTIQRMCELLVEPRRHYSKTGNFLRGIEKTLNIIATVDTLGNSENIERKYSENELSNLTKDSWNEKQDSQNDDILSDMQKEKSERNQIFMQNKGMLNIVDSTLSDTFPEDDIPVFEDNDTTPTSSAVPLHYQHHNTPSSTTTTPFTNGTSTSIGQSSCNHQPLVISGPDPSNLDITITTIDTSCISPSSSSPSSTSTSQHCTTTYSSASLTSSSTPTLSSDMDGVPTINGVEDSTCLGVIAGSKQTVGSDVISSSSTTSSSSSSSSSTSSIDDEEDSQAPTASIGGDAEILADSKADQQEAKVVDEENKENEHMETSRNPSRVEAETDNQLTESRGVKQEVLRDCGKQSDNTVDREGSSEEEEVDVRDKITGEDQQSSKDVGSGVEEDKNEADNSTEDVVNNPQITHQDGSSNILDTQNMEDNDITTEKNGDESKKTDDSCKEDYETIEADGDLTSKTMNCAVDESVNFVNGVNSPSKCLTLSTDLNLDDVTDSPRTPKRKRENSEDESIEDESALKSLKLSME